MIKSALSVLPRLICVAFLGCLGPADEGPAGSGDDSTSAPATKRVRPGSYTGDYGYIPDSLRQGFEAELILYPDGRYRSIWIKDSEAVYDEQGTWSQSDTALYMRNSTENWIDYRRFYPEELTPIEDDTCQILQKTDTSFLRKEWIPVMLRKRQWTRYRQRSYPALAEGSYTLTKIIDSIPRRFRMVVEKDRYLYSALDSTGESFQAEARYSQAGSFLVLEENRERERDSSGTGWQEWIPTGGYALERIRTVSDTSIDIWNPGSLFLPAGWDHFVRDSLGDSR